SASYYDLSNTARIKHYKTLCKNNPKYVVVVQDETQLAAAKIKYGTQNVLTADAVRGGEYEHVILDNPFKALGSALENQSKRSVQLTEKHTRQKDKYDATGQEFVTLFRDGYAT